MELNMQSRRTISTATYSSVLRSARAKYSPRKTPIPPVAGMASLKANDAHRIIAEILSSIGVDRYDPSKLECAQSTILLAATTEALPIIDYNFTHPATCAVTSTLSNGKKVDIVELSMIKEKGIELVGKKVVIVNLLLAKEKELELLGRDIDKLASCVDETALASFDVVQSDENDDVDVVTELARESFARTPLAEVWADIGRLEDCLRIHTANAAAYQSFYAELYNRRHSMERIFAKIQCRLQRIHMTQTQDNGCQLLAIAQDVRVALGFYASYVNSLWKTAATIIPVHKRTERSNKPQPAVAVTSYRNRDIQFAKGDDLLLEDTHHDLYWRVRTKQNSSGLVPSLLVLIPGPDYAALDCARRLIKQLMNQWTRMVKCFGAAILEFLRRLVANWNKHGVNYDALDKKQRDFLANLLRHAKKTLEPLWGKTTVFHQLVDSINDALSVLAQNPSHKDTLPVSEEDIKKFGDEIVLFANLLNYYEDMEASWRSQRGLVRPMEDEEWNITNEEINDTISRLFLEELSKETALLQEELTPETDTILNFEQTKSSATAEDVIRSEQQQQEKFVISSIIDPRTGESISFDEAIDWGILDMENGLYINPKTRISKIIPQAMEEGLIEVTLQTREISEEKVSSFGIIKMMTTKESRPYVITGVVDPNTEQIITVSAAQKIGVLNADSTEYNDTIMNMQIPIRDAIDVGLVTVEYADDPQHGKDVRAAETEIKTYAVHSVVDRKLKKRISFVQAVEKGLINKETGTYTDNEKNVDMFIGDAIQKGFVKARRVNDNVSLDIDPANTIVVERAGRTWNKLKAVSAMGGGLKNVF